MILAASQNTIHQPLIQKAIEYAKSKAVGKSCNEILSLAVDKLCILFGKEILSIIPGRVSTEVDARFFNLFKYIF